MRHRTKQNNTSPTSYGKLNNKTPNKTRHLSPRMGNLITRHRTKQSKTSPTSYGKLNIYPLSVYSSIRIVELERSNSVLFFNWTICKISSLEFINLTLNNNQSINQSIYGMKKGHSSSYLLRIKKN